jgi:hypothetical protein
MVDIATYSPLLWAAVTQTHSAEPLIERLDPPRRAVVIMALLAIALVGLFLVTFAMVGGHWVRKLARSKRGPSDQHTNVENERLRSALRPILPTGTTEETTVTKPASNDTVIGS